MTTLAHKNFSFDVDLQEAYKSPDGTMHVVGIASDDEEDRTGDRMSTKAVRSMAEQANKNKLPLLDNHRSTFSFGATHSASAKRVHANGKTTTKLIVDFALKATYPQSKDLFDEVQSGKSTKQLSIGGFLNLKNPKAVKFEENKAGKVVRVLDDILLEHVATTRPGHAAVPRTKFVSAIVKDIFGDDDNLPRNWQQEAAEEIVGAVAHGTESGSVVLEDGEEIIYDVAHQRTGDDSKRDVIVVMVDRNSEKAAPPAAENVNKPESGETNMTQVNDTTTKNEAAQTAVEGSKEELTMTAAAKKEAEAPVAATAVEKEAPKDDPSIQVGLDFLSKIGKAFAPEAPAAEEVPAEITDLLKSWDKVRASELSEKSLDAVRRVHSGMLRLLQLDAGDEDPNTPRSPFALKSEDIEAIAAAVTKSMQPAAVEGEEAPKTSEDVIKSFGTSFGALTEELAKGLTGMADGFKELVSKEVGEIKTQLETTEKSADERLANLEKAAGVRQSAPGQDAQVATGAQPTSTEPKTQQDVVKSRRPNDSNPFRGMFDGAKGKYLASHR